MEERGGGVAPALGLAWASLVTSRITLSRDETVHSNLDCCKVLSSGPGYTSRSVLPILLHFYSDASRTHITLNPFILAAD